MRASRQCRTRNNRDDFGCCNLGEDTQVRLRTKGASAPQQDLPGVVFALRFGNDTGFVQQFFSKQRDLTARELGGRARCFLAFKRLGSSPVYSPRWAEEVQLDFYDRSSEAKERIRQFISHNRIGLIVFQSANPGEIDLDFLNALGARTINTEDDSFDPSRTQSFFVRAGKFLARRVMKLTL